jgi:hypothetical protein
VIRLILSWRFIFGRLRGRVSFLSQKMWPLRFPLPIPSQFGSKCWIQRKILIEVFSINSSRGNKPAKISSPVVGHFDLTGDKGSRASLWSFLAFSRKPFDEVALPQTWQPYEKAGLTTPSRSHFTR